MMIGYAEILHAGAGNLSPSPVTVYRKSQLGMKILMLAELTTFYVQFGDSQSPMKNLVLTCLKKSPIWCMCVHARVQIS